VPSGTARPSATRHPSEGNRRNRSWAREDPSQRDEAWFKREVATRLDAFSLKEISKATGLSLAACSRIRAGARLPHPRHFDALWSLISSGKEH
jgi:Immunity protein 50